ncbi:MAG: hypothetical protein ACK46L_03775 [Synechococcaceae cyanobacterium]|jgi:hypothetical protein
MILPELHERLAMVAHRLKGKSLNSLALEALESRTTVGQSTSAGSGSHGGFVAPGRAERGVKVVCQSRTQAELGVKHLSAGVNGTDRAVISALTGSAGVEPLLGRMFVCCAAMGTRRIEPLWTMTWW